MVAQGDDLIGLIYEAGALPQRWPEVLGTIASHFGARGSNLIRSTEDGLEQISSPGIAEATMEFERRGYNHDNSRVTRLLARADHPGFLTDRDLHSEEEIATLPLYRDFLTPIGADAGAATVIQGPEHDGLVVTFEAFADHRAAVRVVPGMDRLRPHIARAISLSSQISSATGAAITESFGLMGISVALLDRRGKLLSASEPFQTAIDELVLDGADRLRIIDNAGDQAFVAATERLQREEAGSSVALRDRRGTGRAVLHLIPARRDARGMFTGAATFAVLARPENTRLPGADIIRVLFDLTPAEARVARLIAAGKSPSDAAVAAGVSVSTVRTQLKQIFQKTSTARQSELTALLSRFG